MLLSYININVRPVYFKTTHFWDVNYMYNVVKNSKIIMTKRQISKEEKAMWAEVRPSRTLYYPVKVENKFNNLLKANKPF